MSSNCWYNFRGSLHPIDSIRFQTGAFEGTCPVYSLILSVNKTARFEGGAFCDKIGIYKASLQNNFDNIASYISQNRLDTLRELYNDGTVDVQSATLYIYYRNKPVKMITDMQMHGTVALSLLYEQLSQIVGSATWIKE